jgi:hypothetical protein
MVSSSGMGLAWSRAAVRRVDSSRKLDVVSRGHWTEGGNSSKKVLSRDQFCPNLGKGFYDEVFAFVKVFGVCHEKVLA